MTFARALKMKSDLTSQMLMALLASAVCAACGGTSDDDLYTPGASTGGSGAGGGSSTGGSGLASGGAITPSGSCDVEGTWAVFVEVGVDWQSATIKPGAGTTKQWILTNRSIEAGKLKDVARVCGVGAFGVPLGSPWFSIVDIPELNILDEWTGVTFKPEVFDSGLVPQVELWTEVTLAGNSPAVGDTFHTLSKPFLMGAEGLAEDAEWPDYATMTPLMVDHDGDGEPGISGVPFSGEVPGEAGINFSNPRLTVVDPILRASPLHLAVRTQAALETKLVSCDPPRAEGTVLPGTLKIESRMTSCMQDTGEPCTPDHVAFLDGNLPEFKFNGTSVVVAYKVPASTTCAEVREMTFEKTP